MKICLVLCKSYFLSRVFLVLLQTRVVIIRGLSQDTTRDAVLNYCENSVRSGGGYVEEVNIQGNLARVTFESSEGNQNTIFKILRTF